MRRSTTNELAARRGLGAGMHMTHLNILSLGAVPPELAARLPAAARIVKKLAGPDRPDYWLAELSQPFVWRHRERGEIRWLVLQTFLPLEELVQHPQPFDVAIDAVIDPDAVPDSHLDLGKCLPVATGHACSARARPSSLGLEFRRKKSDRLQDREGLLDQTRTSESTGTTRSASHAGNCNE